MSEIQRETFDTPDGQMTRKQMSEFYGIPYGTIIRRIHQGWRGADIVKKPMVDRTDFVAGEKSTYVTPWGCLTFEEIAEQISLTENAVKTRAYSWPSWHDALNTLPMQRPGIKIIMPWKAYHEKFHNVLMSAPPAAIRRTNKFLVKGAKC